MKPRNEKNSRFHNEAERLEEVTRYNIRRCIVLSGHNQGDLARVWGVSQGAVSQRLSGYSQLKFTEVVLAAQWLGVTIDDLMDETFIRQDEDLIEKMRAKPTEVNAAVAGPRFLAMPAELLSCDAPVRHRGAMALALASSPTWTRIVLIVHARDGRRTLFAASVSLLFPQILALLLLPIPEDRETTAH